MKNKSLKIIFSLLFFLILAIVIYALEYQKEYKINRYMDKTAKQILIDYNAIYQEHYNVSHAIYEAQINTDRVIELFKNAHKSSGEQKDKIRTELHDLLKDKYDLLKRYNLKQMHFHLPNNESFLRMHRPSKYGDNLTGIRQTVEYVNKNKVFIDGFEEGRIFNGYRFVYPLFDKEKNHIGSVEISFSTAALTQRLDQSFKVQSNFMVRKNVVDKKVFDSEKWNYILSPFKNFYYEKNIYTEVKNQKEFTDKATLEKIEANILKEKVFSIYDQRYKDIVTFLPINNPINGNMAGVLVVRQTTSYIPEQLNLYKFLLVISIILTTISLYLIYKNIVSKKELEEAIKKELEKNRNIEQQLFTQAKQAQMGEMIGNIAHQWRQPLNMISVSASNIKLKLEFGQLDNDNLAKSMDDIIHSTKFLSTTIDTFRNFIKDEKKVDNIVIQERIDEALNIVQVTLDNRFIKLIKDIDYLKPIRTKIVAGELSQVIINILNNAKDAMDEKSIEDKWIKISLKELKGKAVIRIEDNAGGIPKEILPKVFDPYFTTKHQSQGTGLGLYMSYDIVTNHLGGKLYAKNSRNGAVFFIEIPIIN